MAWRFKVKENYISKIITHGKLFSLMQNGVQHHFVAMVKQNFVRIHILNVCMYNFLFYVLSGHSRKSWIDVD